MYPELPKVVLETINGGLWDGDKLPLEALPEVKAISVGLKGAIDLFNATAVVGNAQKTVRADVKS